MRQTLNLIQNLTWKGWLVVIPLIVILVVLAQCSVNKALNGFGERKQIEQNNEDRNLREKLAEKRQASETKISTEEKLLNAELAKLPDNIPSDRRIARACFELRNYEHVQLPPECRSGED